MSPPDLWKWKWSNGVGKSEMTRTSTISLLNMLLVMRRTNILTNDICLTCKGRAAHLDCWSGRSHKIVQTSSEGVKKFYQQKAKEGTVCTLQPAVASCEATIILATESPRTIAAMTNCIKAVTLATPRPQSDTTWPMPSFECTSQHLEIHKIGSGTFVVVPIVNHKNIWLRKKSPSLVGSRFEKHGGASGDRSWLRHLLAPILSQLSTISSTTPPGGSGSTPRFTCLLSNKTHSYIILHLFQSSNFEDGGQIEF